MYRSALILPAIFCGANIAIVQTIAQAKTKVEIGRIAKNITVRIETVGSEEKGSGILIQKEGDVYDVLTAAHVVKARSDFAFKIVTPDGIVHSSMSVSRIDGDLDLAVVSFKSSQKYQLSDIGTSNSLEPGTEVYVSGFPAKTQTISDGVFNFTAGTVSGKANRPVDSKGYTLIYSNPTLPGMSGGPVLNTDGQLVAIHGLGDRSLIDNNKTNFNLGIVVERFSPVAQFLGVNVWTKLPKLPAEDTPNAAYYYLSAKEISIGFKYFEGYRKISQELDAQELDAKRAINNLNTAIALNPKYSDAYNLRARIKSKLKNFSGALNDYNTAIEIGSSDPSETHRHRGKIKYMNLNDTFGALEDYNKAIEIDSNNVLAYVYRGIIKHDQLKDIPGAMADWDKAIKIGSIYGIISSQDKIPFKGHYYENYKYADNYYQRGLLKYKKNDGVGALIDFTTAIEITGGKQLGYYADAFYYRGLVKKNKLNDREGAIEDFRRAIENYKRIKNSVGVKLATTQMNSLGATKAEFLGPDEFPGLIPQNRR
jgi:tetratricopeptide (TPR) repeat protein